MSESDIPGRVDTICEAIRALLLAAVPPPPEKNEEAEDLRRSLEIIRAKEYVSVPEAARLLSCSDSHLLNLVDRAVSRTTDHPIPFCDLDGTAKKEIRFHLQELLAWSKTIKAQAHAQAEAKAKAGKGKDKPVRASRTRLRQSDNGRDSSLGNKGH